MACLLAVQFPQYYAWCSTSTYAYYRLIIISYKWWITLSCYSFYIIAIPIFVCNYIAIYDLSAFVICGSIHISPDHIKLWLSILCNVVLLLSIVATYIYVSYFPSVFTTIDAMWHLGVITYLEINLSSGYNFYYTLMCL